MRKLYGVGGALFFDEQTSTSVSVIVASNILRGNPADTLLGSGGGGSAVHSFIFPIKMNEWTTLFSLPWVISKVLVWGIVITAFIKAITLTYFITDIYIIILCIHIPGKYIFSTTLRAYMACTATSVSL